MPAAVHSRGVVEKGAVVHLTTQYLYDDPDLAVSASRGRLSQAGRPFTHGFEFYLDGRRSRSSSPTSAARDTWPPRSR